MVEKKKKGYGEAALELHQKVKKAVEAATKNSNVPCVSVSAVEKEIGKDPRTVKFHLRLLEEAGYGKLSKDGKMFCPAEKRKNA